MFSKTFAMERATRTQTLPNLRPELQDPQVALKLLWQYGGPCKMVHVMRTTPPHLHLAALQNFDCELRSALRQSTGPLTDPEQWHQPTRNIRYAGRGLRSATLHAPDAYVASVRAPNDAASTLLGTYHVDMLSHSGAGRQTLDKRQTNNPDNAQLSTETALHTKQTYVPIAIDKAAYETHIAATNLLNHAAMRCECQPDARAFFDEMPNEPLGLTIPPAKYAAKLRAKLCMPERESNWGCPLCDQILDTWELNSRVRGPGGSKKLRINALENYVFKTTCCVGLKPELERVGPNATWRRWARTKAPRRCNSDSMVRWSNCFGVCCDAPRRQETFPEATRNALATTIEYTQHKRGHTNTENICVDAGVKFLQLAVETARAWPLGGQYVCLCHGLILS